jgi:hypothetical protein
LHPRNNSGSLAAPPLGELPNNLLTSKPGAACPPEIFTKRLVLLLGVLYDENMLELFILYKLSDIRQEIAEQEEIEHQFIFLGTVLQIFIWPVALFAWVKRNGASKLLASAITAAVVAVTLIINWGVYIVIGFFMMLVMAFVIAYAIVKSNER